MNYLDRLRPIPILTWNDLFRFWSKVKIETKDKCWLWLSTFNTGNYGVFGIQNKVYIASRVMYFIHHKRQPKLLICHECDNVRCVNPHHLFEGTTSDNIQDASDKGRWSCGDQRIVPRNLVTVIREKYSQGVQQTELAKLYGYCRYTIFNVVHHKRGYEE